MNARTRARWLAVVRSWPGGFYPGQYAPEGATPEPPPEPVPNQTWLPEMEAGRVGGIDPRQFPRRRPLRPRELDDLLDLVGLVYFAKRAP